MKLSNELLDTLKMLLEDRRDQAHTKLYDAYAHRVSYQHFNSHTQFIQECVRELDSIQKQLDEIILLRQLQNPVTTTVDELADQYTRFHESNE